MPIAKREFESGKIHSTLEEEIYTFLNERKDRAFTSQEIMEGLNYHAEFSTPEISRISTFAVADFATFLHHLVEKEKIRMKIVRGRMYIMAASENPAKCPKCGGEIARPRKSWKMTSRPNKRGESLQMQIGLFQCPRHGAFRAVLQKQRVRSSVPYKAPARRRPSRRRAAKRKPKSTAWTPI
jgi:predicted RNA-binding Zn-ribbon protein involved in translation (DUF1610 family)